MRYITFDALFQSSLRDMVFRRYHSFQRTRNVEDAACNTSCFTRSLDDLREDREPAQLDVGFYAGPSSKIRRSQLKFMVSLMVAFTRPLSMLDKCYSGCQIDLRVVCEEDKRDLMLIQG